MCGFDGTTAEARMMCIEYIISEKLYKTLLSDDHHSRPQRAPKGRDALIVRGVRATCGHRLPTRSLRGASPFAPLIAIATADRRFSLAGLVSFL